MNQGHYLLFPPSSSSYVVTFIQEETPQTVLRYSERLCSLCVCVTHREIPLWMEGGIKQAERYNYCNRAERKSRVTLHTVRSVQDHRASTRRTNNTRTSLTAHQTCSNFTSEFLVSALKSFEFQRISSEESQTCFK